MNEDRGKKGEEHAKADRNGATENDASATVSELFVTFRLLVNMFNVTLLVRAFFVCLSSKT